jgi:hypothetical protein
LLRTISYNASVLQCNAPLHLFCTCVQNKCLHTLDMMIECYLIVKDAAAVLYLTPAPSQLLKKVLLPYELICYT